MAFTSWLTLFSICLLGAMTPGPSLAVVIRHSVNNGWRQGVICAWAHALGIGFYALLSILGLSWLVSTYPYFFKIVTIVGAIYLFILGCQHFVAQPDPLTSSTQHALDWPLAIRDGLAISILNPKILLFFTLLFSQFVSEASNNASVLLVATPLVVDGLWYSVVAAILGRTLLLNWFVEKAQTINYLLGSIFILLSIQVIYSSFFN